MDNEDDESTKPTQSTRLDLQNDVSPPPHELVRPEVTGDDGGIVEADRSGGVAAAGETGVDGKVELGTEVMEEGRDVEGSGEVDGVVGNLRDNAVEETILRENSEEVEGAGEALNGEEGFIEGVEVHALDGSSGEMVVEGEVDSAGADDNEVKAALGSVGAAEVVGVEVEASAEGEAVVGEVDSTVGADDDEGKGLLDSIGDAVENDNNEKVSDVVENEVGGAGDKVVESEEIDKEVVNAREGIELVDALEGVVVAEVRGESALPKEEDGKVLAEVVDGKEVAGDANVVEALKNSELVERMELKPIKEMVHSKELADDDANVAEAPIMLTAEEDRTISEALEVEGMVEDANVADRTENTTVLGAIEDTVAEAALESKNLAVNAIVAEEPGDTVMLEGTEEPPASDLGYKVLGDDAIASMEPKDITSHEEIEGMAVDNLVEVKESVIDEGLSKVPKETAISEATVDSATAKAVEVKSLVEDVDAVDTCMTDTAEDMEMAGGMETDAVEEGEKTISGNRKRGRPSAKTATRKKIEEDVCFICFDGGDLVLCDRRGCPKAYHPSCVNHDEAFFQTKGQWNCGWHLCTACQKNASNYMCYTCTFSLCKRCTKDATILCIRGNKGFCQTCMKTIMLIEENNQQNMEQAQVNFDDRSSWEYLFKDYWLDLKGRLCITSNELAKARNPCKGVADRHDLPDELNDPNNGGDMASEYKSDNVEVNNAKRKKAKKRIKAGVGKQDSAGTKMDSGSPFTDEGSEWASKELLEFVMHMRNGDKSVLSQFDVQALLLEYIKRHKLRDPRRKSQIVCDPMLQNLFGKQRVGHFEMLKLLESHFLIKEHHHADDLQGSVVDTEMHQLEVDGNSNALTKTGKDKKRKNRKKGDGRVTQMNLDDYGAIDIHNINLIYLRRNLVEELLEDDECFHEKVVGSFVRIRIFGNNQKQDIYRLVKVVGTIKTAEPYKVGKRMTDIVLEILNLNKTEIISIDVISNQDFTEDECKRLRQSIKCGLINRLTVGDILEKAMALHAVRVNDWLQSETMRVSHLRDRASDLGRRKELRECVEKLQLLKMPEERQRRLEEVPEVHADPKMDPSHESEEDEDEEDDKTQETVLRPQGTNFSKKVREAVSPQKQVPASNEPWCENRSYPSMNRDLPKNLSAKDLWNKSGESNSGEKLNKVTWNQGREMEVPQPMNEDKSKFISASQGNSGYTNTGKMLESVSSVVSVYSPVRSSAEEAQSSEEINESEKLWHYRDPSGKIQGPFSILQLRKWNNTGYFPADLRIWKSTEKQEDSIFLTDALTGKFQKDPLVLEEGTPKASMVDKHDLPSGYSEKAYDISLQQLKEAQSGEALRLESETGSSKRTAALQTELPRYSASSWSSDINSKEDLTNLPSPTPLSNENRVRSYESKGNTNPLSVRLEGFALEDNPLSRGYVIQQTSAPISLNSPLGLSSVRASGMFDDSNVLNMIPTPGPGKSSPITLHMLSQSTLAGDSHTNPNMPRAVDYSSTPATVGGSLQNVYISGGGNNPLVASQGCMTAPSQNIEPSIPNVMPSLPSAHGHWGSASSNMSGNFGIPNSSGVPPAVSNNEANIQCFETSNLPRFMGLADNPGAIPGRRQENQSTVRGQMPMAGNPTNDRRGLHPRNPNMHWGAPGQGPAALGTGNISWAAHGQSASGQAPAPGNAIPGWVPGNQGPNPVTMNSNWPPGGQGLPPGNAKNSGWSAPTENLARWGADHNSRESFSGQRDRVSHGGDPAYDRDRVSHGRAYHRDRDSHGEGRGRPWSRQTSIGSGGVGTSRPFTKSQGVCKFHENGHCKKGASCDYLHT